MDLFYSLSLLLAFAAGGLALLLGIVTVVRAGHGPRESKMATRARLIRAALRALCIGAMSLVLSVAVHRRWGHGPLSGDPMDVARFISEHEAFLAAAFVLVAGVALVARAGKRS